MRGLMNIVVLSSVCCLLLGISSASYAGMNPFKKSKDYTFGPDVSWYEHNDAAVKSGSVRDGSDTNYYHLNVDKHRLLLRLGKNDPGGELENTRRLENLAVIEVKVDDRRLPLFNWCLINQQDPGKKLKQNAVVANDVCINAGGGGDFVIYLDDESRNILKNARVLELVVEPYGRPVKLTFSMSGYAAIMAEINKPVPPPVVKKPEVKSVPVVVSQPKPKPVVKVKPKLIPVKMCTAKAPAGYSSSVPAISYPCDNTAKKSKAEALIAAKVKSKKQKKAAEIERLEAKKRASKKVAEDSKRETEWDKKQATMWLKRCEKNWAKNRSPCYCEKYLNLAPPGIKSTCAK